MRISPLQLDTMPRSLPSHALPLMPAEMLLCPETAGFGPLHRGALFNLCIAYWQSRCTLNDLPEVDLMSISGCYMRRWQTLRVPVLKAFEAIRPRLASVYADTSLTASNRLAGSQRGGLAASKSRKLSERLSDHRSDVAPLLPREDVEFKSKRDARTERGHAATLSDAAE